MQGETIADSARAPGLTGSRRTVSMRRRCSRRGFLSLMSPEATHVLTWSRRRCSFLISFFRSASNFSRWLALSVLYSFFQMSSKFSIPSAIFLKTRSTSAEPREEGGQPRERGGREGRVM